jgi:hypothetical protein
LIVLLVGFLASGSLVVKCVQIVSGVFGAFRWGSWERGASCLIDIEVIAEVKPIVLRGGW